MSLPLVYSKLLNDFVVRGVLVLVVLLASVVIHGYAIIPLKRVPGPWISRVVPLRDLSGRPVHGKRLFELHQKYGTYFK
jgi:hypothetical protein